MTPLLATAGHTGPDLGAWILLAVLAAAGHLLHCVIWPYRPCRKCGGAGRFRSPSGRAWRYCNRCSGRGAQLRTGRRIWTHLKNTNRNR
ncbi:cobalamin B12-binding domain-containing protein [Actinomadura graeca]|uniref:cobalamin B12-binding domain-containing protein n=1 Tax=Actinomadura graeca TaxID=2750812 RepID=UPI001E504AA2|nr:cobalamin B12-binding domain-containing protein [Actinomadura graeca]